MSVGIDHDTAQFAVAGHPADGGRRWAASAIPTPVQLLITADGGGSNGSRCRLWKVALQSLAGAPRAADPCVPLPAGHQQMEQDRASHVLLTSPRTGVAAPW